MDLRSVLSFTVIVFVPWTHAKPILKVPARCSHVESTFYDPRMYVEHDCSDVCDYTAPETSPSDCLEQCPDLYKCLTSIGLQGGAAARIERSHVTQRSYTDENTMNGEAAKIQRTTSCRGRTSRSANTEPRTDAPFKTMIKQATRLMPNEIVMQTQADQRHTTGHVTSSSETNAWWEVWNHPWQMYLLTMSISFFGTLSISLVGIMIWRCCRARNAKSSGVKPGEKDGLVSVTVQNSDPKTESSNESP